VTEAGEPAAAVQRLDEITRRLRAECPWDREQDERSIVPHTVEEAYELADAAHSGDDRKLLDELGDVLFQVHFLSLLLEERGAGDLAAVADHCRTKLIRRHPHVFGEVEVADAAEVLRNWDDIKRAEEGRGGELFADVPETLPGTLYARKLLRRAASGGRDWPPEGAGARLRSEAERAAALSGGEPPRADQPDPALVAPSPASDHERDARFDAVGDLLLAAVALARELRVDPELALRAAADRFRREMEGA
jgi:XTP/dITP diphosphohydrolase/tetrapyrrole methylase family protein/MazG family protein/ATP diphosphatase